MSAAFFPGMICRMFSLARFLAVLTAVCCGWFCVTSQAAAGYPNIIMIFSDDQGTRDVGCYGSEIPTPHMDSLARDGMKFDQFYAASAICTPSRFGLLTGCNPSRSQDRLLSALMFLAEEDKHRGLRDHEITMASQLQRAGYETALIGKWHLGHGQSSFFPHQHGFDLGYGHTAGCVDFFTLSYGNVPDWYRNGQLLDTTGYATDVITDEAVRYIRDQKHEKPFFLFLPYNAPHFGKGWDDGNDTTVNILQPHPRDLERVKFIKDPTRRKYAAMAVALDDGIGRVLDAVDGAGLRDDTLIIFMSDHGGDPNYGGNNQPLRGDKATLFEGGIRVPCLARWPGVVAAGSVAKNPAWAIDWFTTLAELTQVGTAGLRLDGQSLLPVLRGVETKEAGREFFWELGSHAELDRGHWQSLRRGAWKYIKTPDQVERLFHLERDPFEKNNVAGTHSEVLKELASRADQLSKAYSRNSQTGNLHAHTPALKNSL